MNKALNLHNLSKIEILERSGTSYLQKTVFTDNPGQNILEFGQKKSKMANFQKSSLPDFAVCFVLLLKIQVSLMRLGTRLPFPLLLDFNSNLLIS